MFGSPPVLQYYKTWWWKKVGCIWNTSTCLFVFSSSLCFLLTPLALNICTSWEYILRCLWVHSFSEIIICHALIDDYLLLQMNLCKNLCNSQGYIFTDEQKLYCVLETCFPDKHQWVHCKHFTVFSVKSCASSFSAAYFYNILRANWTDKR